MSKPLAALVVLVAVVVNAPVIHAGEGDLRASAARVVAADVRASAAQAPSPVAGGGSKGLLWGGLGMAATGGTLAILSTTALKRETCGVVGDIFFVVAGCIEETNKALLWTGIGLAAGGSTLAVLGARASVGPGHVALVRTVRF